MILFHIEEEEGKRERGHKEMILFHIEEEEGKRERGHKEMILFHIEEEGKRERGRNRHHHLKLLLSSRVCYVFQCYVNATRVLSCLS